MKEKLNVVQNEPIPVETFKLTADQIQVLPDYFRAREEFNAAAKTKESFAELLNLPKFEGKKVNVQLTDSRGRVLAVVEVRQRDGYPVPPGWTNKLIQLK